MVLWEYPKVLEQISFQISFSGYFWRETFPQIDEDVQRGLFLGKV